MAILQQPGLKYGTYYGNQPNRTNGPIKRWLIIGVIVAALAGVGLFAASMFSSNAKSDLTLLAVRENSLLQLATTSQKTIRDPDLSVANSNTAILLTSDVATVISATGIKNLPADLVKQEADTNGDKLKQADLLDKFDSTYRHVVLDKVSTLTTEAQSVRDSTGSKTTRATLDQILANLDSINKQFTQLQLQ